MFKKITLLTVLFLGFYGFINAQEKITIGIIPFTFTSDAASSQYVNSIQESVTNAIVKTKRFNIVDRSKMEVLKKEKELQKTEDFIDGAALVEQSKSLGAQYLVSGHVNSATANEMITQDPKTGQRTSGGFKAKLSISLKVIDVTTGQVTASETIEPKGGSMLAQFAGIAPTSAERAIDKALNDVSSKIDDFVAKNFPIMFSIVEIQEKDSKGSATKIFISGGSAFGLKKGQKLKVIEISEINVNGKMLQRKKEIGELKITKVEDENFSTCSVNSGGIDINSRFEAKGKISIMTTD